MDRVATTFFRLAVIVVLVTTVMRNLWGPKVLDEWGIVVLLVSTLVVVEWERYRDRYRDRRDTP